MVCRLTVVMTVLVRPSEQGDEGMINIPCQSVALVLTWAQLIMVGWSAE